MCYLIYVLIYILITKQVNVFELYLFQPSNERCSKFNGYLKSRRIDFI